ncbi:MAG: DinB family protein [Acidobacteria bacterium]|nr:DinB family protein [Acidobacteriota bacterium]
MLQRADAARLFGYDSWANHRLIRAAATLTTEQFKRDLGSSHGGVRGTLTHVLSAEWIWLERWKGVSPSRMLDESEFPDVLALRERWRAVDEHRDAWFASLKKGALSAKVRYRNTEGKEWEAPLWQLIQHVVNHSTYHRGQVTTLLRLLGAKAVSTDIVLWDREREAKKARGGAA